MSFATPLALGALALIPILAVLYVRAERRAPVFAPARLMPSVAPRRPGWRRHVAIAGYGAALTAVIVALAKPQTTVATPTQQARVMIVTDHSGSMQAQDVAPDRLTAAKTAIGKFLDAVPEDIRVGAIAYGKTAEVLQSPTRDRDAVKEAMAGVEAVGRTATGDAITTALDSLDGTAPAAILLLSDGKSVLGEDPVTAAQAAADRDIPIFTVALGTDHGTVNGKPVLSDPATLRQIADATGGEAFAAADADRLDQVYERLGREVATEPRKTEVTNLFAGGGLALLVLSALSSIRLRGRLL